MSVIINNDFSRLLRQQLKNDLDDDDLIIKWFIRIITIKFLETRNIFSVTNYSYEEIIKKCYLQNEMFKGLFNDNLDNLIAHYPKNFFNQQIIELLNQNINSKTPIENIISLHEEFKNAERLSNFTSTNRNSDVVVDKDNITTITQIYTPSWIAKYMIHSSIGVNDEFGLENNQVDYAKIKILDPCLGAGHLILEAFNFLLEKRHFTKTNHQIIKDIYKNQLYGFDIDENVITVAKFLFLIKGFELDDMFLKDIIFPNFYCIKEFHFNFKNKKFYQIAKSFSNGSLYGSLINVPNEDYDMFLHTNLTNEEKEMINLAKLLNMKYDLVITNPPYMGKKVLPKQLSAYLNEHYKYGKSELYTAFIERCLDFLCPGGKLAMLTLHTWMFIKTFQNLRSHIITNYHISSLIHLGKNTFENLNAYNALACAFIIANKKSSKPSLFIKLDSFNDLKQKKDQFFNQDNYYYLKQNEFFSFKDNPFIYWLKNNERNILLNTLKLASYSQIRQGLATGDNKRYIRYWYEVDKKSIAFSCDSLTNFQKSDFKYALYNKGGDKTKWYTTSKLVIKFDQKAYNELLTQGNHLPSRNYYFKAGITWSLFGFNSFNVRYKEQGYVFDVSGSSLFTTKEKEKYILAFLSSNVAFYYLSALAPTVNFQVGNIANLPFIYNESYLSRINQLVDELLEISKEIDFYDELSWNFKKNIILSLYNKEKTFMENLEDIQNIYHQWYQKIIDNEKKINEIFNQIYKIDIETQSSSKIQVKTKKILIEDLISFFIGVIFKRYKIEEYTSIIDNQKFILINEIYNELYQLILKLFGNDAIRQINEVLNCDLFTYLKNNFGKIHLLKYHNLPLYWYKVVDNNYYIAYYHTLKEIQIDKELSIKDNYLKYNLLYKLKK